MIPRFVWDHKILLKIDKSDEIVKEYATTMSGTCWQQLCPYSIFNVGLDAD
jgi:hypothetical protein